MRHLIPPSDDDTPRRTLKCRHRGVLDVESPHVRARVQAEHCANRKLYGAAVGEDGDVAVVARHDLLERDADATIHVGEGLAVLCLGREPSGTLEIEHCGIASARRIRQHPVGAAKIALAPDLLEGRVHCGPKDETKRFGRAREVAGDDPRTVESIPVLSQEGALPAAAVGQPGIVPTVPIREVRLGLGVPDERDAHDSICSRLKTRAISVPKPTPPAHESRRRASSQAAETALSRKSCFGCLVRGHGSFGRVKSRTSAPASGTDNPGWYDPMTARPHRIERIDAGAGTQTMPLVETDTLTKQFEPRVPRRRPWDFLRRREARKRAAKPIIALDGVLLAIEAGECYGLPGPNGAGCSLRAGTG